jgi:hypothetical protein
MSAGGAEITRIETKVSGTEKSKVIVNNIDVNLTMSKAMATSPREAVKDALLKHPAYNDLVTKYGFPTNDILDSIDRGIDAARKAYAEQLALKVIEALRAILAGKKRYRHSSSSRSMSKMEAAGLLLRKVRDEYNNPCHPQESPRSL